MRLFPPRPIRRTSRPGCRSHHPPRPTLRFSPTAWAKLLFLRDFGDTEVGGFGISAPDDLLRVEDFVLVPQVCSAMTVAFDDEAVADYFDQQIDAGRTPAQTGRIWIHTHPGDSAQPSGVDEETFERVFGRSDWAVMAIVACGGQTSARLQFHTGPGGAVKLPLKVDFQSPFGASDHEAWRQEYLACVKFEPDLLFFEEDSCRSFPSHVGDSSPDWLDWEFQPQPDPPFLQPHLPIMPG